MYQRGVCLFHRMQSSARQCFFLSSAGTSKLIERVQYSHSAGKVTKKPRKNYRWRGPGNQVNSIFVMIYSK